VEFVWNIWNLFIYRENGQIGIDWVLNSKKLETEKEKKKKTEITFNRSEKIKEKEENTKGKGKEKVGKEMEKSKEIAKILLLISHLKRSNLLTKEDQNILKKMIIISQKNDNFLILKSILQCYESDGGDAEEAADTFRTLISIWKEERRRRRNRNTRAEAEEQKRKRMRKREREREWENDLIFQ